MFECSNDRETKKSWTWKSVEMEEKKKKNSFTENETQTQLNRREKQNSIRHQQSTSTGSPNDTGPKSSTNEFLWMAYNSSVARAPAPAPAPSFQNMWEILTRNSHAFRWLFVGFVDLPVPYASMSSVPRTFQSNRFCISIIPHVLHFTSNGLLIFALISIGFSSPVL